MDSLTIHFDVAPGFAVDALAAQVAERLAQLEGVQKAEAEVEDERFGVAETVAVIGGIVLLTKAAREGVDELRKLISALRGLVSEVSGLRGAVVDFGGRRIPLDEPDEVVAALKGGT